MIWVILRNKQSLITALDITCVNAKITSIESGLSYSVRSASNSFAVRESAKEKTAAKAGKAMLQNCRKALRDNNSLGDYLPVLIYYEVSIQSFFDLHFLLLIKFNVIIFFYFSRRPQTFLTGAQL